MIAGAADNNNNNNKFHVTSQRKVKIGLSHGSSRFRFCCFVLSIQIVHHPSFLLTKGAFFVLLSNFITEIHPTVMSYIL